MEIFPFSRLRTLLYPNGLLSKERPKPIVNLRTEITFVNIKINKRQEIMNKAIMQTRIRCKFYKNRKDGLLLNN